MGLNRRWLVTGGCGFIGTNLVSRLVVENPRDVVLVMDNLSIGRREDLAAVCEFLTLEPRDAHEELPPGVYLCEGDLSDTQLLRALTRKVDRVVHLAANTGVEASLQAPVDDFSANASGTLNVLEACRLNQVRKVVFASSGAVVGHAPPPIDETVRPAPLSPYGASKLAGETYCHVYSRTFGVSTVCLRFGNVYGPRSRHKSSVVARFIRQALRGETCTIFGDGGQTRDFIFVGDLIEALVRAADAALEHEIFQISSSREVSVLELALLLKESLAARGVDMRVAFGDRKAGEVIRSCYDTAKARALLGWSAATDLETGLDRTLEYFVDRSATSLGLARAWDHADPQL